MKTTTNDPKIIVALDFDKLSDLQELLEKLSPEHCRLKVGKAMFTRFGPDLVENLRKRGFEIFLDLKFHDIPQQVAGACRAAADLNVWMITVHASGGAKMLEAAHNALQSQQGSRPNLVAVTVLTSLNATELHSIGIPDSPQDQVMRLAKLSVQSGVDGIVCSPQELNVLRPNLPADCKLVTPGIRPENAKPDDQQRTLTPQQAIAAGADYLVIGRPITQAADPLKVLQQFTLDINKYDV